MGEQVIRGRPSDRKIPGYVPGDGTVPARNHVRELSLAQLAAYRAEHALTLAECEAVVTRGLKAFVEVGNALLRIRDERLYRETHSTFEAYCRERWGLSKPYATQLIVAADTVAIATAEGLPLPRNEAVARELAPLRDQPEKMREVYGKVVEIHGKHPTAAQTRAVVVAKTETGETETVVKKPNAPTCPTCAAPLKRSKRWKRPADHELSHYLPDMLPGASQEGELREMVVDWCFRERDITEILKSGVSLPLRVDGDAGSLLAGLARVKGTASELEKMLAPKV